VYVAGVDRTLGEDEWRPFVERVGFGHLVAPGRGLRYPVVAPTQYRLDGGEVLLHLVAQNPAIEALQANPRAVLSVAGDWSYIPSDWKALDGEDPMLGIPTTYYAAVQLKGRVKVLRDPGSVAELLRRQLATAQPDTPVADPEEAHASRLRGIRGIVLIIEEIQAKFKYGGNVDVPHREAVIERLTRRAGPGDAAAAAHTRRRIEAGPPAP
jgi:transcriptional regulator